MTILKNTSIFDMIDHMLEREDANTLISGQFKHKYQECLSHDIDIKSGKLYKKQEKDKTIYKLNIAGIKKENIKITVVDGILVVQGLDDSTSDEHRGAVAYLRRIKLNKADAIKKISSKYTNGILEISVPILVSDDMVSIKIE